jgi:hypothetical protein
MVMIGDRPAEAPPGDLDRTITWDQGIPAAGRRESAFRGSPVWAALHDPTRPSAREVRDY